MKIYEVNTRLKGGGGTEATRKSAYVWNRLECGAPQSYHIIKEKSSVDRKAYRDAAHHETVRSWC